MLNFLIYLYAKAISSSKSEEKLRRDMEFRFDNVEEALEKCWELVRTGQADLFRGQTRDWPKLIPSLFRSTGVDRQNASIELGLFKEWGANVPQMAIYDGNDGALTAVAQHYGISTSFLDVTTNPEIAVLFSKTPQERELCGESVVYCFLGDTIRLLSNANIVKIDVKNLWRLESQRGLFIEFLDEGLAETLRNLSIRIYFPAAHLCSEENDRLYPVRKSALEIAIDQWVYRRQIESAIENFSGAIKYNSLTHRQTYPGIFRWRKVPEFGPSWFGFERGWVVPPIESVSLVAAHSIVTLPVVDLKDPVKAKVSMYQAVSDAVRTHKASGRLISFSVKLSTKNAKRETSVSKLINRCWDGIRVLPYQEDELVNCISLVAILSLARAERIRGVDNWPEQLFGPLKLIETAPIGGHIEAGVVSRADFQRAQSEENYSNLTRYARRKIDMVDGFLGDYATDPWISLDFSRFRKIYVEQFIPTAIDSYWKEDLKSFGGRLECMWSISFNPALLGYLTPFEYRFRSPVAAEIDCDQIIYIEPDMDRSDLEELFISCMPGITGGGAPYILRFNGYNADSREVWQIPRVVEQARWIVEVGGISVLEVFPSAMPKIESNRVVPPSGLGAFEVWMISMKKLEEINGKTIEEIRPIFDEFMSTELPISNANIETRATSCEDWPG